jgi:hypothetical protein
VIVIGGLVAVFGSDDTSFPYAEFDAGECSDIDTGDLDAEEGVGEIPTIDCDEEHTLEGIGQFDLEGDDFPDDDDLAEEIDDGCTGDLFEDYVGADYSDSVYLASGIPPSEDASDEGARTVVCAIYGRTDDEDLEGPAQDSEE